MRRREAFSAPLEGFVQQMGDNAVQSSKLKVVILAAAQGDCAGIEYPRALQRLGDKAIIDHVLELARHFASPKDI